MLPRRGNCSRDEFNGLRDGIGSRDTFKALGCALRFDSALVDACAPGAGGVLDVGGAS